MKNIEKYEKEILQYDGRFAVTKEGQVVNCSGLDCKDCLFLKGCAKLKMQWLMEEYKVPILDDKGKDYIKTLVSPFTIDDIVTIVKHNVYGELRYELIVNLVHAQMYVYFDRQSTVGEMLSKMKSNHSYRAKELGLC